MPNDSVPGPNSVGWFILEGYPWWPVFVCDATKLREDLHELGSGHRKILKKARDFPRDFSIIYYFGSHEFGLVALKKPVLKKWDCDEKEKFLEGFPKNFVKKKAQMDELKFAIQEAEEYLAEAEDIRVPPCMVPSDLDPTLEPPPKIEVPSEDEEEEKVEGEGDEDGEEEEEKEPEGDDEEEVASEPSDNDDDDDDAGEDEDSEDDKKKTKKSKKTKEKKPSAKKEKEMKDTKKPASKKSSTKESKKDKDVEMKKPPKKETKKRPSPSTTSDKKKTTEESKKKVVKTEEKSDVKKEEVKAKDTNEAGGDDLVLKLEKEIEWILENSQFEELTTRKVRKILEERLKMDLKNHKATIKASVTRVINAMNVDEEGTTTTKTESETPVKSESEKKVKDDAKVNTSEEKEAVKKEEVKEEVKEEIKPSAPKEENLEPKLKKLAEKISNAKFDDEKLLEAIQELEKYNTLDKEVLKSSPLLICLVDLRAHHADDIGSAIGKLVTKWNCEDLVPKPFHLDDIIAMKKTLENDDTSHDEILKCLKQLSELPLRMSDMKKTGISLTVSNLRSHANDKVSLTAKNLRDTWKRRLSEQDRSESFQKLVKMRRILEKKDQDQKLQETQLSVLKKLSEMKLKAQVIIDTVIGVAVSKLRKSSNPKLAAAAKSLRNKWAAEHRK